jgi:hypothetical protein
MPPRCHINRCTSQEAHGGGTSRNPFPDPHKHGGGFRSIFDGAIARVLTTCLCRRGFSAAGVMRPSDMSNVNIIVLSVVPVRALADQLRMHPVDVVKDVRARGYRLGSIRGAVGRWTMALRRNDAERYLDCRRWSFGRYRALEPDGIRDVLHQRPYCRLA